MMAFIFAAVNLIKALATDTDLQRSFFNTTALYHELPAIVPDFHLSLMYDISSKLAPDEPRGPIDH